MLNKYGNKFQEVSDSGDETYYVRHFGVCQIGEKDIELAVVANIKNLDGYISASEIPKEGKFQLSTSLVPYPKYMSKKLLEEANDDGVSVSDNELVNVDNYMGGLNYSPSEIVYFKDSESAESYLMSKELNDSIDGNATMIGYVLDKNYNRIGQTNWDYLRYMIGETERFANGGAVNAKSAKKRLEYLRKELRAERISYGELVELQSLKEYIDSGDVELLQAAGVPEFEQQADIEYSKIYDVLKEKIDDAIGDIKYENTYTAQGEEVDHESRDGFMPFTDGGYNKKWFEYESMLSGTKLPTKQLDEIVAKHLNDSYKLAQERFEKEYPSIVEQLGKGNIDYNSLKEAGYDDEAEQLSEWESDTADDSIMMGISAYYYAPDNRLALKNKHTVAMSGYVNLEAPYHRSGNLEDYKEITFSFNSLSELKKETTAALSKIIAWFKGSDYNKSKTKLGINKMAQGGTLSHYHEIIQTATGCPTEDLQEVENYMRDVIIGDNLSSYSRELLSAAAKSSWSDIQYFRTPAGKAYLESGLTKKYVPQFQDGGAVRANRSPVIRYANFEDGSHINLLRLNPLKGSGTLYKSDYKYAVSESSKEGGQKVTNFKDLKGSENAFDDLVAKRKLKTDLTKTKYTQNYADGGILGAKKETFFFGWFK